MADVRPIHATHYDLAVVGSLDQVAAPPYDVIDAQQRTELLEHSRYNAVAIDLPKPYGETGPQQTEGDPYARAAATMDAWREAGALVADAEPTIWAMTQDYTGPDGTPRTRHGILARVRVEDFDAGQVLPHERTLPGPKQDRLDLTRATRHNLSPIFSLHPGDAWRHLEPALGEPWGEATDDDGTVNRAWRVGDPAVHEAVAAELADAELLIADGHHRYETARVYADEVGGEGEHRYVLMCLVALQDSGLTVFPTHRLIRDTTPQSQEALANTLRALFAIEEIDQTDLRPPDGDGPLTMGYIDSHFKRAFRLTLEDQASADEALAGMPEAYRHLDTAVLEALVLNGPLGLSEDDIAHLKGLGYSRTDDEALQLVLSGEYDAAFFLRSTPIEQVRAIAAAGVNMPPKSTYFFPKVPTGLLFNPLL
jgi:uncharacterized protein (DUF1015 family)